MRFRAELTFRDCSHATARRHSSSPPMTNVQRVVRAKVHEMAWGSRQSVMRLVVQAWLVLTAGQSTQHPSSLAASHCPSQERGRRMHSVSESSRFWLLVHTPPKMSER